MVVGTARLVLSLPGNRSLKGKRKVLRRIVDRVRHRFNAAIAEVDDLDVHQRLTLGVTVVSNDASHAQSMLDTVVGFVATAGDAVLVDRRAELIHLGQGEHLGAEPGGWDLGSDDEGWDDDE